MARAKTLEFYDEITGKQTFCELIDGGAREIAESKSRVTYDKETDTIIIETGSETDELPIQDESNVIELDYVEELSSFPTGVTYDSFNVNTVIKLLNPNTDEPSYFILRQDYDDDYDAGEKSYARTIISSKGVSKTYKVSVNNDGYICSILNLGYVPEFKISNYGPSGYTIPQLAEELNSLYGARSGYLNVKGYFNFYGWVEFRWSGSSMYSVSVLDIVNMRYYKGTTTNYEGVGIENVLDYTKNTELKPIIGSGSGSVVYDLTSVISIPNKNTSGEIDLSTVGIDLSAINKSDSILVGIEDPLIGPTNAALHFYSFNDIGISYFYNIIPTDKFYARMIFLIVAGTMCAYQQELIPLGTHYSTVTWTETSSAIDFEISKDGVVVYDSSLKKFVTLPYLFDGEDTINYGSTSYDSKTNIITSWSVEANSTTSTYVCSKSSVSIGSGTKIIELTYTETESGVCPYPEGVTFDDFNSDVIIKIKGVSFPWDWYCRHIIYASADLVGENVKMYAASILNIEAVVQCVSEGFGLAEEEIATGIPSTVVTDVVYDGDSGITITQYNRDSDLSNSTDVYFKKLLVNGTVYNVIEGTGGGTIDIDAAIDAKIAALEEAMYANLLSTGYGEDSNE